MNVPTTEAPTPLRLSFTRVDTYERCPRKYQYGYVDELPQPPSPHLSFGSSLHAALEVWWDRKLPDPPPLETLLDALYEHWDSDGFADLDRDEQLRWYTHARDVLARHHARFAAASEPTVAVEQWFELPLPDEITVVGAIDLVVATPARDGATSGGLGVVDWKTNRRARTREEVADSLQLAIYALATEHLWGQRPEWIALDFVVPGVRVTVPCEEIDTDRAVARIRAAAEGIRAEAFDLRPSTLCRWCDFRAECPAGTGDGPAVAGAALTELRRLQRRRARDATRIAELEQLVTDRLGADALPQVAEGRGAGL